MASLDFEHEKITFRTYYENNRKHFVAAKNVYIRIISTLIKQLAPGVVAKIEGRVKDQEECIKKFHRKYQDKLEVEEQPYEIKDFISDMIGVRIVCFYEDQIAGISEVLQENFKFLHGTDKISLVENTDDSFGYKSLHMDLGLNNKMKSLPKYQRFADVMFEVQIRSLIQDAWSVLDHQIKYKKSIPIALRRRINILSALFEMADREFREIRDATAELLHLEGIPMDDNLQDELLATDGQVPISGSRILTAFNFLRITGHFFRDFEFIDYKVDNFVHEILKMDNSLQKAEFHECLSKNLKTVREYRDHFLKEHPNHNFSPYASIRHCLFLNDSEKFQRILARGTKDKFASWLQQAQSNSS